MKEEIKLNRRKNIRTQQLAKLAKKFIYRFRYIDFDMKAVLKMFILKQLAKRKMSGYEIMKKCEEILGYRPSAGSIYPLLKAMEEKKIIVGKKEGRKIVYALSEKGKKFIKGIEDAKEEFYKKLNSQIKAMAEIFGDENIGLLGRNLIGYPALPKILFLLEKMDRKKANEMLEKFYRELRKCLQ